MNKRSAKPLIFHTNERFLKPKNSCDIVKKIYGIKGLPTMVTISINPKTQHYFLEDWLVS
jgi:hypothetical protein